MIFINWIVLLLVGFTATGLVFSRDYRWSLALLAVLYLGSFWMVQTHWPISMASVKLVTGWMACAVLGIAQLNARTDQELENIRVEGRLFHAFATAMVVIATFAISLSMVGWLGLNLPVAWAALLLIGTGLLHLGISSDPFQVIIGLLTVFAGFEILYTTVETSALVTALLAVVNLGLALSGAYFVFIAQGNN